MTDDSDFLTDAELVIAARGGDPRAFGGLVMRYRPLVLTIAQSFTGNECQAEEVAQETFITAWKLLQRLKEPDRFRSWVYGIARLLGRRSRYQEMNQLPGPIVSLDVRDNLPSAEPSPFERAVSHQEQRLLSRALGAVPEAYRAPLVLFYQEYKSIRRVADALALSSDNVRQRLLRGRRMLHEQLTAVSH